MPDNDNPNYALLLEEIDNLKRDRDAIREELKQVTEFNRQLLARKQPDNSVTSDEDSDTKVAKEKLEKYIGG